MSNRRNIKIWLKGLSPNEASDIITKANIPAPYDQILRACCVKRLSAFDAISELEKDNIYIGYWSYVNKLGVALDLMYKEVMYRSS